MDSLGFMELLGYDQDYYSNPPSVFDNMYDHQLQAPSLPVEMELIWNQEYDEDINHKEEGVTSTTVDHEVEEESSVVLNEQCISEEKIMGGDGIEAKKKKKKKKEKEPRFAFMTRTEIDHLDDGYRWRKYGQKAVKNSHFPRSYYRCTSASCNVKKRVERCMGDPFYVITTYEGKHNHPPTHKSAPLISSFNHLPAAAAAAAITATPPAMLKLEQEGLLQDMLPCHH